MRACASPSISVDRTLPQIQTTSGREEFEVATKTTSALRRRRRATKRKNAITKATKLANDDWKTKLLVFHRKKLLGEVATQKAARKVAEKNVDRITEELAAANKSVDQLRVSLAEERAAHTLALTERIATNTDLLNAAHHSQREQIARLQQTHRADKASLKSDLARATKDCQRYRTQRDELRREKEQAAALVASLQLQLQRATFPGSLP